MAEQPSQAEKKNSTSITTAGDTGETAPEDMLQPTDNPTKKIVAETLKQAPDKAPIWGFITPESSPGKEIHKLGVELTEYRNKTIDTLPGWLVNHSSNVFGTTHMVGEVMMFKASGNKLYQGEKLLKNGGKGIDYFSGSFQKHLEGKYPALAKQANGVTPKLLHAANPVIEPVFNIWKEVSAAAKIDFKAKDLLRPGFYKESLTSFLDLKKAAARDRAKLAPGRVLVNRWQTRATFFGMAGMLVAATMPEDRDTPEEVKKLSDMSTLTPGKYALRRIGTAINPLQWWDNKRAFVGLTFMLTGTSTFLAGFRNVGKNSTYYWNKSHGINGVLTALAGEQLLMGVNSEKGWSGFAKSMWARMIFLPTALRGKYGKGDFKEANFYSAGQASFQGMNAEVFLFGGVDKLPDGTIVQHKVLREQAMKEANIKKQNREELQADEPKKKGFFGLLKKKQAPKEGLDDEMPHSETESGLSTAPQMAGKPDPVVQTSLSEHELPTPKTASISG
jgi:hypothetical protein